MVAATATARVMSGKRALIRRQMLRLPRIFRAPSTSRRPQGTPLRNVDRFETAARRVQASKSAQAMQGIALVELGVLFEPLVWARGLADGPPRKRQILLAYRGDIDEVHR